MSNSPRIIYRQEFEEAVLNGLARIAQQRALRVEHIHEAMSDLLFSDEDDRRHHPLGGLHLWIDHSVFDELDGWSTGQVKFWQRDLLGFLRQLITTRDRFASDSWRAAHNQPVEGYKTTFEEIERRWQARALESPTWRLEGLTIRAEPVRNLDEEHVALLASGPALSVLRYITLQMLGAAGVEKLAICDCGLIFFRRGRGLYCSGNCQRRVWIRNRRAERRNLLAAAEAAGWPRMKVAGLWVQGTAAWRAQVDTWDEAQRLDVRARLGDAPRPVDTQTDTQGGPAQRKGRATRKRLGPETA